MVRERELSGRGEDRVLIPFPGGRREKVPATQHFRSTWLCSSLRSIRDRGLYDEYVQNLDPVHREAVESSVVGTWLPIEVAVAHYRACDALMLSVPEMLTIGREATNQVHGTLLGTFVRLAKGAGVTPWTVLGRLDELWRRIWLGGGLEIMQLGPKEARVYIAGWPCAGSGYCRIALRGVIPAVTDLFCTRSYAREINSLRTPDALAYTLSWA
jgi:hypothetical protein